MASSSQRLRRVALPAVGIAAALALTACSGGQTATSSGDGFEGVSLTVWNNIDFEPYQGLQKQYFESCAADLGITVDVQTQSGDYTTKLLQAAGAKALPDVALLSTDTQLPQLASQGVLADLSTYGVSTDGLADSAADLGRYDGTLYGLPVQVEDYAIFYNKAAFAAAGVPETAPKTFADLETLAKSLTTDSQKGIVLPGIGGDGSTPVYFLPFLLSAGGDPAVGTAFDPVIGGLACTTASAAVEGPGVANYEVLVTDGFTLLGALTVTADLSVTGEFAYIAARLVDVDPESNTKTLIARGLYRLDPGAPNGRQSFQLHPNGWRFVPGHIARLELLGRDAPYARPSNGTFSIEVSNLEMRVPIRETLADLPLGSSDFDSGLTF